MREWLLLTIRNVPFETSTEAVHSCSEGTDGSAVDKNVGSAVGSTVGSEIDLCMHKSGLGAGPEAVFRLPFSVSALP
jgi:hypothetical protein